MILDILLLIIFCSLAATGFYIAAQFEGDEEFDAASRQVRRGWQKPAAGDKMIFWWVRYYGGRYLDKYWSKPVYSCLPCMGSLHSILPTFLYFWGTFPVWYIAILWAFVALGTVGLNYLITQWWKK